MGRERVPSPIWHAMHASESNKLTYFHFGYLYAGRDDAEYILIMKDDHSKFVLLDPASDVTVVWTLRDLTKSISFLEVILN